MPPLKGNPGALEADAPEFLDFLISVSPADRQKLYRQGLDQLNASAKNHFHKSLAELDTTQADSILKPLLVARPWPEDLPGDPMQTFIAQVHEDFRTATMNSREWAAWQHIGGRFTRGSGMYWAPIDPVVRGLINGHQRIRRTDCWFRPLRAAWPRKFSRKKAFPA